MASSTREVKTINGTRSTTSTNPMIVISYPTSGVQTSSAMTSVSPPGPVIPPRSMGPMVVISYPAPPVLSAASSSSSTSSSTLFRSTSSTDNRMLHVVMATNNHIVQVEKHKWGNDAWFKELKSAFADKTLAKRGKEAIVLLQRYLPHIKAARDRMETTLKSAFPEWDAFYNFVDVHVTAYAVPTMGNRP